jgi:hypothetical protein
MHCGQIFCGTVGVRDAAEMHAEITEGLSLNVCQLRNPGDEMSAQGAGPLLLEGDR